MNTLNSWRGVLNLDKSVFGGITLFPVDKASFIYNLSTKVYREKVRINNNMFWYKFFFNGWISRKDIFRYFGGGKKQEIFIRTG
jgi:hypothetical protein